MRKEQIGLKRKTGGVVTNQRRVTGTFVTSQRASFLNWRPHSKEVDQAKEGNFLLLGNKTYHLTLLPPSNSQKHGTQKNWRRSSPGLWGPPMQSHPATHQHRIHEVQLSARQWQHERKQLILQNLDELWHVVRVQKVPDAPVDAHWNGDVLQKLQKKWITGKKRSQFFSAKPLKRSIRVRERNDKDI